MTPVAEAPEAREIICKAHFSGEILDEDFQKLCGADVHSYLADAVFQEIILQAAFQIRKQSGMSIRDVQDVIHRLHLDSVADLFGHVAQSIEESA